MSMGAASPTDANPIPFEACVPSGMFVFVSYAHADRAVVYPELKRIATHGVRIWYDEGIAPTSRWPEEIADAIGNAALFIVMITAQAVASENVRDEIYLARRQKKPTLAIHLARTSLPHGLDLQLGSLQAIMRWQLDEGSYARRLAETLQAYADPHMTSAAARVHDAVPTVSGQEPDSQVKSVRRGSAIVRVLAPIVRRGGASFGSPARAGFQPRAGLAGDLVRSAPVVVGDIPHEPPGYQRREGLLAQFDPPSGGSRVSVVHAVTGMRGVGKTHLAAAYARARLADGWRLVAWVNADDSNALTSGLADVAASLGLRGDGRDGGDAGRMVRHRLEADGDRCLVVFDNVTDPDAVRPFVPAVGAARVLITTTLHSAAGLGQSVPVDVFTDEEALAFLAERTGGAKDGAQLLAAELGRLPLALAQAAAVIAAQRLDYDAYLDRLRQRPIGELLKATEVDEYPYGLAAAVLLSIDSVRAADGSGLCGAVMDLVSVMSPAAVSRSLLHAAGVAGALVPHGRSRQVRPDAVDDALARLAGASLLTFTYDGRSVIAHRLVMRVLRERLVQQHRLARICAAASMVLASQATSLREAWPNADRSAMRDLVGQITAVADNCQQATGQADDELNRRVLRLRRQALYLLNQLWDSPAQAIADGEGLLPELEQVLGPDDLDTLGTRNDLANAYWFVGRFPEALELHERTLADRERILGPDHRDTLNSRNNLANAYFRVGRTAEALQLHERTLADRERVLGPEHPLTLESRNNIAVFYQESGRPADAIPLHERTLADRERVLGPNHAGTLGSRGNLANAYLDVGRISEALPLHEQTVAGFMRMVGANHPDTLEARDGLAKAYLQTRSRAEAIRLHQHLLADCKRILGPEHPRTQQVQERLVAITTKTTRRRTRSGRSGPSGLRARLSMPHRSGSR